VTAWSTGGQTRREKVSRRLRTIPAMVVGFLLTTALFPILLLGLGAYDLVRAARGKGRFAAVRLLVFGWVYMLVDLIGVTSMLAFWLVSGFGRRRQRYVSLTYGLQGWWAWALLGSPARSS
jgi:hypothetical protein